MGGEISLFKSKEIQKQHLKAKEDSPLHDEIDEIYSHLKLAR